MYPLDAIYGPKTYRAFCSGKVLKGKSLKDTLQSSWEVAEDEPLLACSYTELVDIVSFLSIMNKRHALYFRGQGENWPLIPSIFRPFWTSLSKTWHSIGESVRERVWSALNEQTRDIVQSACERLPMPRPSTLRMFREASWAIAQHYELWPTPLIDITPNLRVAASFALWDGRASGHLYVVALPASTNSVTFDADQHVVLARLAAVCPPVAKRPHFQDGFLAGRFPFLSPVPHLPNAIDRNPAHVSDLSRRLVARIELKDSDDADRRKNRHPTGQGFWSDDFPRMSPTSLIPEIKHDQLLEIFSGHMDKLDKEMDSLCKA